MKMQERPQVLIAEEEPSNPLMVVLLVTVVSMIFGLIPVVYSSTFAKLQSQTPIALGEAGLWSAFGEKADSVRVNPEQ
ncbi:CalY family protein [Trichocoleus sp. ST-U3]